jgi:hypothetical protein
MLYWCARNFITELNSSDCLLRFKLLYGSSHQFCESKYALSLLDCLCIAFAGFHSHPMTNLAPPGSSTFPMYPHTPMEVAKVYESSHRCDSHV